MTLHNYFSWISTFWGKITEPHPSIQNPEQREQSKLLASLLLAINLVLLVFIARYLLDENQEAVPLRILTVLFSMGVVFFAYRLCYWGRYKLANLLVALFGSAVILVVMMLVGGLTGLRSGFYLIIITLFASMFLSPRATILIAAGQIIGLLLLPIFAPTIRLNDIVQGPLSFNLLLTAILLLLARWREYMEQNRQARILESEAKYRQLVDNMRDIVYAHDVNGIITAVNPALKIVTGWEPEEWLGKSVLDIVHPDHKPEMMARWKEILIQQPSSYMLELRARHKDGGHVWVEYKVNPMYQDGKIIAISGIGRDISLRKAAEEALQDSERKNRVIIDLISDALFILNERAEVVDFNTSACRIYGYTPEEMRQIRLHDLVAPDFVQYLPAVLTEAVDTGDRVVERINRRKDGSLFPIEHTTKVFQFGGQTYFASFCRDISERKQNETQKLKYAVEHERLSLMSHFVQSISHDFRTALANIESSRYLIYRILQNKSPQILSDIQPKLDNIEDAVKHFREQLESLHTFSSLAALKSEVCDVNALVVSIIAEHRYVSEQKQIALEFTFADSEFPILGDKTELRRAIRHLVVNALNHTPSGGKVGIHTYAADKRVCIEVHDTGSGIAPEHFEQIFNHFFRADSARSLETGGVGLGLSIVKLIVEAHGGSIKAESKLGEGSVFTLLLPM